MAERNELKEKMPYHECPGFNACSCNDCPLDPLSLVAGGSLHFGLKGEAKCRAEKPTRQRIASKYPDLLRFVGLSKRHFQAQQAWNALPPEKRDLKLQALANARKSLFPRVMGVDDRQVLNTKEPKQAILKDINEAPRRRVPLLVPAAVLILGLLLGVSVCFAEVGTASYYTYKSCVREGTSGVWTASGERYNENDLTAAMWDIPFGAQFMVTNMANNKIVIVRINDRGPSRRLVKKGRIIDLSKGAFLKIADLRTGVINVSISQIKK